MKALTTSFDGNAKTMKQNAEQHKLLSEQIKVQEQRVEELNSMLEKSKTKYGENATQTQKWQQAVSNAQAELNTLRNELNNLPTSLDMVANKISEVGSKIETLGTTLSNIGSKLTTAVTVPIVGFATKAVTSFAEVDKTMQLTNATMGNTAEEASLLNDAMESAASNSTFAMSDAATATLNFARAGLDATQAADALAPAMNLAAGEGGTLDTVSAGLVATINGFGDSFDQAEHYADVFANACNNSALDVDSLSESLSVAAPIFSAAGYAIEDATLYMGTMANAGIDASEAANALKTGFARLVSPAKEGSEAMESLGLSVTNADGTMKDSVTLQKELHDAFSTLSESEQIAAASAIFGKNQMSNWLALINTAPDDVSALSTALEEEGTTAEMAEAMMGGFGGSIEKLKSSFDVLMTSMGRIISSYLVPIIEKIQTAIDAFQNMSDAEKDQIVRMGALAAAVGPLMMVVGKILTVVGKVMQFAPQISTAFKGISTVIGGISAPMIAIAGIVLTLVAAFKTLWETNEEFRTNMIAIWEQVKTTVMGFVTAITERFNALGIDLSSVVATLEAIWMGFCSILGPLFQAAFQFVADTFQVILDVILGILDVFIAIFTLDWEKLKLAVSNIVLALVNYVVALFRNLWTLLKGIINAIAQFFGSSWNEIKETVINTLTKLWEGVVEKVTDVKDAIFEGIGEAVDWIASLPEKFFNWGSEMLANLAAGIESGIGLVTEKISAVVDTIASFIHFSEPDKGALSDFNSWMPDMMHQMAQGIENGRYLVQRAMADVSSDMALAPQTYASQSYVGTSNNLGSKLDSISALLGAGNNTNVNVTLQGDAAGVFRLVRTENNKFRKSTGYNPLG